jgi:ribonuclease G
VIPAPVPVTAEVAKAAAEPAEEKPPAVEPGSVETIVLPGETIDPALAAASAASGQGARGEDSGDRRGGMRRRERDRDRRGGKKPKIPSFEPKNYETRDERKDDRRDDRRDDRKDDRRDDRKDERHEEGSVSAGTLAPLPGESLARYSNRPESASEPSAQENVEHVHAEAMAEEIDERRGSAEGAAPAAESAPSGTGSEEGEKNESGSARITDRSDVSNFAHRPVNRRQRRRPSGPEKSADHVPRSDGGAPRSSGPMISELLREGQEILVQVSKEPLGKKGARITSHIALPGRYLVYMPTVDHIGVSRKIASDEERQRLKRIIHENRNGLPGGFIVRTAAEGRGEDEFIQDLRFLGNLWSDIRAKSEKKAAPALIHRDLNLVQRMLRDQLSPDFRAIRLDNETEFATVLDFVNKFQPALVNRVKLHLKDTPIFEEYGLNVELDRALRPKVWLKSGGYIVINQTEALVAIDVNTGKYVGKSNRLEDTIVRTNVDAVNEIVRQIRLRNLGGIIVVDFIDMEEKKNRQRVMAALEEAIRADRSPSKILQFNDFGLVAITRKRTTPSLERTICAPCSHCNGSGWTKSPETICYDIQQEVKKMAQLLEGKEITIRVNPEVAKVLKSCEFVSTHELEEWTKRDIIIKSDPLLHEEHFDIF